MKDPNTVNHPNIIVVKIDIFSWEVMEAVILEQLDFHFGVV